MRNRIQSLLEVLIVGTVGIFLISACGRADRSSAVSNSNIVSNGNSSEASGHPQMCLMIYPKRCQ